MAETDLTLLVGRLEGKMDSITKVISEMSAKITDLPCNTHTEQIETIIQWKTQCVENEQFKKQEKFKGSISLKNAIILIVMTNLFTIAITLITNYLIIEKL